MIRGCDCIHLARERVQWHTPRIF